METPNPTPEPAPTTAEPTPDERTWGMLCHLGSVVLYFASGGLAAFLCPLVIWMVKKDESDFIAIHAKESLNFQITFFLVIAAYLVVFGVLSIVLIGIPFLLAAPLLILPAAFVGIMASMAANRGELYRYPFSIRFLG